METTGCRPVPHLNAVIPDQPLTIALSGIHPASAGRAVETRIARFRVDCRHRPVASLRLSFPSAYPTRLALDIGRQPISSSRFDVLLRPCGFPRHSASRGVDVAPSATVVWFADHAPPASFSAAFRYRDQKPGSGSKRILVSALPSGCPRHRPWDFQTLRCLGPAPASVPGFPWASPCLPFSERPPRQYMARGPIAFLTGRLRSCCSSGRSITDAHRGSQVQRLASRRRLIASFNRVAHVALGFACSRESRNAFGARRTVFAVRPSAAGQPTTGCPIRSWGFDETW